MMKTREASVMRGSSLRVAVMMVSAATVALSGCYIFSPSQAQEDRAQTRLHFDITQCQQTAPNLLQMSGRRQVDLRGILCGPAGRLPVPGQRRQRDCDEAVVTV
jgi:hypothetical protein